MWSQPKNPRKTKRRQRQPNNKRPLASINSGLSIPENHHAPTRTWPLAASRGSALSHKQCTRQWHLCCKRNTYANTESVPSGIDVFDKADSAELTWEKFGVVPTMFYPEDERLVAERDCGVRQKSSRWNGAFERSIDRNNEENQRKISQAQFTGKNMLECCANCESIKPGCQLTSVFQLVNCHEVLMQRVISLPCHCRVFDVRLLRQQGRAKQLVY